MTTKEKIKKSTVRDLKSAGRSGDAIGALVWWSVADISVSAAKLANMLTDRGLDASYLPPPINAQAQFSKAITKANATQSTAGRRAYDTDRKQMMLRRIVENTDVVVYGVVEEKSVVKNEDLKYRRLANVRFNKTTRTVEFTGTHPLLDQVKTTYTKLRSNYSSSDISKQMITNVRELCQGVPVRDRGGVYYVPPRHIKNVEALVDLLAALGHSSGTVITIARSKSNVSSMQATTHQSLIAMVDEFKTEVAKFKKDGVRPSTLKRRISAMKKMKNRILIYAEALGLKVGKMTETVDALSTEVNEMITEQLS